jgi:hypothetical protein
VITARQPVSSQSRSNTNAGPIRRTIVAAAHRHIVKPNLIRPALQDIWENPA